MAGMPAGFPPVLIELAHENPSHELAWQYPAVLEVVAALALRGYAILGGEVMHDNGEVLDYYHGNVYCGNWYRDRKAGESWAEYVAESVSVTVGYIDAYVRRNGDAFWFVPTFADEDAHNKLQQCRV